MFWQSVIGGLAVLAHWQVWVALVLYAALQFGWFIGIGMLMGKSASGGRMTASCLAHMIGGPVFQSVLLGNLVLFLTPLMLGTDQTMPLGFFVSLAWPIVMACFIALVLSFIIGILPIVGDLVSNTPGLATFIQGIIIFRIFSAAFIERLLEETEVHVSNLYPGFWSSVGYFTLAASLVYACLFIFAALGTSITRNRSTGEDAPLVFVGMTLMHILGLLPLFMYANHVALAIQQAAR
jgi:hypothetical protein